MGSEWRAVAFGSLMSIPTRNGIHKGPKYQGRGVPVVKMGEVYHADVIRDKPRDSLDLFQSELKRLSLTEGDLLFCRTSLVAEGVGHCALVGTLSERSTFASNLIRARLNPKRAVPRYWFYYFRSPIGKGQLLSLARGTSVTTITGPDISALKVVAPDLCEQRAIAHILGTLDDKIEMNRRMNETLEAMARALFKSWFVDFDPVRAKAQGRDPGLPPHLAALFPDSLVDSELGEIPDGWRVGKLGEVAEHPRRGVQPKGISPDTPYIALEHMPKRCIALSDWGTGGGLESNKFEFRRGEILFGKLRPYFHKVGVAPVDGVCSTDIVVLAPKTAAWFGFVLGHTSSESFVDYTNAGSTGTKMPRTSWNEMARYEVALPPEPIARIFNDQVRPLVNRITACIHESRTLAALRDALLSKLISGEIRVKDAEQIIGGIAT